MIWNKGILTLEARSQRGTRQGSQRRADTGGGLLLRFWESDIQKDLDKCVEGIKGYASPTPRKTHNK